MNDITLDEQYSQNSSVGSELDWYLEGPGSNLAVSNCIFNWRKIAREILTSPP